MEATYNVIGKRIPRKDGADKVTGRALYGADLRLPRTLVAKLLRSPHPHARILNIDVRPALALAGVKAVVTGQDVPATLIGRFIKDRPILARDKVRYIGDPVAAVVAVDENTAQEATERIKVDYQVLPALFDPREAMTPQARPIHEDLDSYQLGYTRSRKEPNILNYASYVRGDTNRALAQADVIHEEHYVTQVVHQGFTEPHSAVVYVEPSGQMVVWSSTKSPFVQRNMIAQGLGIPMSRVRVIASMVGGDFGGKGGGVLEPLVAFLALKVMAPIKLVLTREEEFVGTFMRHPALIWIKAGAQRDGTLVAVEGRLIFDVGAYSDAATGLVTACLNLQGPYRVANINLEGFCVYTNNTPSGHVRAPGAPQTVFAGESHMDALAHKLGMEPLEFRLRNAVAEGDTAASGRGILRSVGLRDTIQGVKEYLAREKGPKKKNQGWGVACGQWHASGTVGESGPPSSAILKVNEDGTATLLTGTAEQGAGQHTILAQIVAQVLDIPFDNVSVVAADTDATPYEAGTGGSATTYRAGSTVKRAAEDAREQLLRLAAEKLEANVSDLEMRGGRVYVQGSPQRGMTLAQLGRAALSAASGPILGVSSRHREALLAAMKENRLTVDAPCYGTQAAQVEVDPETGQVRVLRYFACQDVGRALNPSHIEGQIHGCVVSGIGYALTEEVRSQEGKNLNVTFADYRMPTAPDAPPLASALVEKPTLFGPYGAKGVGEPPTTPVAAVIANAIYDAVGVRVTQLPMTPERVVTAIRKTPGEGAPRHP
ncbi:MAG: xanthine dehydrogenase family protein molybdopterin-binding subunit [Chloroflexi bacterium]|nr:xanthine dehydrogenase family protein molybdopterin-binding subunit [Chloroflexota bacterium]